MHVSNTGIFIFLTIVIVCAAVFGGFANYSTSGAPSGVYDSTNPTTGMTNDQPGFFGVLSWVWNSVSFMFKMVTFQITGVPFFISIIFVVISLIWIYLLVNIIRGVSS